MAKKRRPRRATTTCPQCAGEFEVGRLACPHCGSDAQTGWKDDEDIDYEAADVPDAFTDEDYEDALADVTFPGGPRPVWGSKWTRRKIMLRVVGLLLVASMVLAIVALAKDVFF